MRNIDYTDPGGGALHAIVGTLEQVAICTVISVPIAILVGVYLVEYGRGPFARVTTFMVDILTGIPSIVAALFIFTLFVETFERVAQRLARVARAGHPDGAGDRAHHRGDAQARPERAARGVVRARRAEVEDDHARSSSRPRSPG